MKLGRGQCEGRSGFVGAAGGREVLDVRQIFGQPAAPQIPVVPAALWTSRTASGSVPADERAHSEDSSRSPISVRNISLSSSLVIPVSSDKRDEAFGHQLRVG